MKLSISELDLYRKGYVSIYVTATHLCNLQCKYCYDRKDSKKAIDRKDATEIIAKIESINLPKYFYDIFGGEFILVQEWPKILELFLKTGKEVSLNTNGTLIDTENIKILVDLNKKYPDQLFLSVSLDSTDSFTNQQIRPGKASNYVYRALSLLTKNGLRYRVAITLTSKNKSTLIETVKDIVSFYSKEIIIGILRPTFDQNKYGHIMIPPEEAIELLKEVAKLKEEIGDFELYHCLDKNWETFCEAGCDRICILPNGDITPCYTLQQKEHVVGNIHIDSMESILKELYLCNHNRDKKCLLCEHQECYFGEPVYRFGTS